MRTALLALAVVLACTPVAAGQPEAADAVSVPAPTEKAMRYYRGGCVLW